MSDLMIALPTSIQIASLNRSTQDVYYLLRQKALKACQEELERLRLGKYQLKKREQIKTRVNTLLQQHKVKPFLSVKVVKPRGQARNWIEVILELAERLGLLSDLYTAFNEIAHLEDPYRLDPTRKYSWEEICDRWARSYCGARNGLGHFLKHGFHTGEKRSVEQSYPRVFHRGRIPLYLEHFIGAGEEVKKFTESERIPWDTSDYVPLMHWRPCPAHEESPPEFDLFVVNQKLPFLTFSFTSENPWLMELAEHNGKVFSVGINTETARRKGINEGDLIDLETPGGRKARAIARLTQGLHPECLAVPGILGRWVTANDRMRGKGVHFNSLIEYTFDRLDTLSAALDACVKVKISVVHKTEEEGGSHA